MSISLGPFLGLMQKADPKLLNPQFAQVALDCDLSTGSLAPARAPGASIGALLSGTATFQLWANKDHASKTYYEIRARHPKTQKQIYKGEQFVVDSSPSRVSIESLLDIVN